MPFLSYMSPPFSSSCCCELAAWTTTAKQAMQGREKRRFSALTNGPHVRQQHDLRREHCHRDLRGSPPDLLAAKDSIVLVVQAHGK